MESGTASSSVQAVGSSGGAVQPAVEGGEDRQARKRRRAEIRERNEAMRSEEQQAIFEEQRNERRLARSKARAQPSTAASSSCDGVLHSSHGSSSALMAVASGEDEGLHNAHGSAALPVSSDDSGKEGEKPPLKRRRTAVRRPNLSAPVKAQESKLRALIGKTIVLGQNARREKRGVPSTPLVVTKVLRVKERFVVVLEGSDPKGEPIKYRDSIGAVEDVDERYNDGDGVGVIPLAPTSFTDFFTSSMSAGVEAERVVHKRKAEPLSSVMPEFRTLLARPPGKRKIGSRGGCMPEGAPGEGELQDLLVHCCQCFMPSVRHPPTGSWTARTTTRTTRTIWKVWREDLNMARYNARRQALRHRLR